MTASFFMPVPSKAKILALLLGLGFVLGFFAIRALVLAFELPLSLLSLYPWLALLLLPNHGRLLVYPVLVVLGTFTILQLALRWQYGQEDWNALISVVATYGLLFVIAEMIVRSIARLHRLNQDLNQAISKAQDASVAKGRFLAVMSHEIRTPLSGIIGMTDWLLDESLLPKQRPLLNSISDSANALLNIVNSVLDFSRIEAGKLTLDPSTFELKPLLEQLVDSFHLMAQRKSLDLKLQLSADLPHYVYLDKHRLRQVLANLLSNAIKFTPKGQVILTVVVRHTDQEPRLSFAVKDTGIGIDRAYLDRLFVPFEQLSGVQEQQAQGSGLGLIICKEILTYMGAELRFKTQLGRGSEFGFDLPMPEALKPLAQPAPLLVNDQDLDAFVGKNKAALQVLVAEDNPVNMLYIRRLLEKAGATVTAVGDGEQAVKAVDNGCFDLVILDVQMPVMSGLEAVRIIRQQYPKGELPVVALTACVTEGDRQQVMEAGFDQFVPKPVNKSQIQAMMMQFFIPAEAEAEA